MIHRCQVETMDAFEQRKTNFDYYDTKYEEMLKNIEAVHVKQMEEIPKISRRLHHQKSWRSQKLISKSLLKLKVSGFRPKL